MRKYIVVAIVSALCASVVTTLCLRSLGVASQDVQLKVGHDLANDHDFVASLQAKINENSTSSTQAVATKDEKGDTGSAGANGHDGQRGSDGTPGASGHDGSNGADGHNGSDGAAGPTGATGAKGDTGVKGDTGAQGQQGVAGIKGDTGTPGSVGPTGAQGQQGIQGESGLVAVNASGLSYDSGNKSLSLASGYGIPQTSSMTNWNSAYSWGNHAAAGYALRTGVSGGQTLIGGLAANDTLTLQNTSATTGNTGSSAAITMKVGNAGTPAFTALNNGNTGIGTTTPGSKLTVAGDVAITTNGADAIKPFQFVQVTGIGDDAHISAFNSTSYSVSDWNPAVIGFQTGYPCGTGWSSTTSLNGIRYWWNTTGGNWQLNIDMSGPSDGCNNVQVMFVRKEVSARSNYGF